MILFEDCLIILKVSQTDKARYTLEHCLHLWEINVETFVPEFATSKSSFKWVFSVYDKKQTLTLCTLTEDDKEKWLENIEVISKNCSSNPTDIVEQYLEEDEKTNNRRSMFAVSMKTFKGAAAPKQNHSNHSSGNKFNTINIASLDYNSFDIPNSLYPKTSTFQDEKENIPDIIEINDRKWIKAISAIGIHYWYNKELEKTSWTIPTEKFESIRIPAAQTTKTEEIPQVVEQEQEQEQQIHEQTQENDNYPTTEDVSGFPDWRRVELEDGTVYYFNKVSRETVWDLQDLT
jgi:hypothetical protein